MGNDAASSHKRNGKRQRRIAARPGGETRGSRRPRPRPDHGRNGSGTFPSCGTLLIRVGCFVVSLALLFCGVPFLLRGRSKCWRSIENCGFSVKGWSRPGTRDPDEAVAGRPARGGFSLAFLRYWRKKICKVCIFLCSFH